MFKQPSNLLLTVPRRWFWCGSCCLFFFCVRVWVVFRLVLVHYTFSSVLGCWVTTFWEIAAHSLAIFSHRILSICDFGYFHFGFERKICLVIAPVPIHCFLVIDWRLISKIQLEITFGRPNCNAKLYAIYHSVTFAEQYLPCLHSTKWPICKLLTSKITKCIFAFKAPYHCKSTVLRSIFDW